MLNSRNMLLVALALFVAAIAAVTQPKLSTAQARIDYQVHDLPVGLSIPLYATITKQTTDSTTLEWAAYWAKTGKLLKGNLFSSCARISPGSHRQCITFTAPKATGLVMVKVWPVDNKDGASSITFPVVPAPPRP